MVGPDPQSPGPQREITLFGYSIHVAPWSLDRVGEIAVRAAPAHTWAVITDENVGPIAAPQVVGSLRHFAPHSRVILRTVPPGEAHKTRETWATLSDWLLDERCGRDTTIIALGGGVVGDLAGFVAATFLRGVPVIQVPTSLLAMVDASVGGKVAVDTPHGKNLIGAFHQPAAVVIDPTVLQTLPLEHLRAGFAEVLKHGVIADGAYLEASTQLVRRMLDPERASDFPWHGPDLVDLVARSVEIKADVVRTDEREAGRRQVLNFGHTIGHALETCSDFAILHGEAIAVGMLAEARIAAALGLARATLVDRVRSALSAAGLPQVIPASIDNARLLAAMSADKKARRGRLIFALPMGVGTMAGAEANFGIPVDDAVIIQALEAAR